MFLRWHTLSSFLPPGRTTLGTSVTQMDGQLILSIGDLLTGEGPQLLLRVSKASKKGNNKGFEATYDKAATSFHLQKASVRVRLCYVLLCFELPSGRNHSRAEHKLSIRSLSAEHLPLGSPDSGLGCVPLFLRLVQNYTIGRS